MKRNWSNIIIVACIGGIWLLLAFTAWLHQPEDVSASERRKLTQRPELNAQNILSGKFMKDFESYTQDQFPGRFTFRTWKAYVGYNILKQKDNNDIYIEDGFAVKLEYPLKESSIHTAVKKFNNLYEKYMKENGIKVFVSVIPDKGYFFGSKEGYPSMDYEKLFGIIKTDMDFAEYIDLTDVLTIEDYYTTDIHWRQDRLQKAADRLGDKLGITHLMTQKHEILDAGIPFYGVYYGQSALPLKPDKLYYIMNEIIKECTVYNIETGETLGVYDMDKLNGRDAYDLFLSGAAPLLEVTNPNAETDKELIIFRDSFGSSIAPYLLEGYSKITLVDIRYIASDFVGDFVEFNNQDVLFLYSTPILNSAAMLK